MKRRGFLQTVSLTGGLCTLSGCLSSVTGNSPNGIPGRDTTTTGSRVCEPIISDTNRVVCQQETDDLSGMVSIEPESETFTVNTDTGEIPSFLFTLHNRTKRAFVFLPDSWHIVRQTRNEWRRHAAGGGTTEEMTIAPGDKHVWSLSLQPHPTPRTDTTTFLVADLPDNAYKFIVVGHFDSEPATQIELQATFTLQASSTEQ